MNNFSNFWLNSHIPFQHIPHTLWPALLHAGEDLRLGGNTCREYPGAKISEHQTPTTYPAFYFCTKGGRLSCVVYFPVKQPLVQRDTLKQVVFLPISLSLSSDCILLFLLLPFVAPSLFFSHLLSKNALEDCSHIIFPAW